MALYTVYVRLAQQEKAPLELVVSAERLTDLMNLLEASPLVVAFSVWSAGIGQHTQGRAAWRGFTKFRDDRLYDEEPEPLASGHGELLHDPGAAE